LLIQKQLIKSAYDGSSISDLRELERSHDQDFFDKVGIVKGYNFLDEFIHAVKEEEQGIQRIIEAYERTIMNQSLS
jgi:hypothetical protein